MAKLHVKKGDTVEIIAGESKGQRGRVIKVIPEKNRAIVEGETIKKASKHTKPNSANPQGGIVHTDIAIHVSNMMVVDSKGNKTRVGRRNENDKNIRYSVKTKEEI